MKAIVIPRNGEPEVFENREYPDPTPEPNEVVIEVEASGVNFADIMGRMGLYPDAPKLPFAPGYEVAGKTIQVGSDVQGLKVGEPVFLGLLRPCQNERGVRLQTSFVPEAGRSSRNTGSLFDRLFNTLRYGERSAWRKGFDFDGRRRGWNRCDSARAGARARDLCYLRFRQKGRVPKNARCSTSHQL